MRERVIQDQAFYERGNCLFCDCEIPKGGGELHHFPIPARHGGKDTFLVCRSCHDKADRIPLTAWGSSALFLTIQTVWANARTEERWFLWKMWTAAQDGVEASKKLAELKASNA